MHADRTPRWLLVSCALALASGCATAGDHWVEIGGERYTVELADDDAERARGLMFREHMPDDAGMLFIHEGEAPRSYWMMNTRIPLDILYFDGARRLVAQRRDTPPCRSTTACPSYPSGAPARFVLELNAGEAARLGLQEGDVMQLGPTLEDAAR